MRESAPGSIRRYLTDMGDMEALRAHDREMMKSANADKK